MKTDNIVKLAVDAILRREHFLHKSNTWYRDAGETILVVNVQKSNFGQQYYINLGVLVKSLCVNRRDDTRPKETDCHIRSRIESLKPEEEVQLKLLLDLED